MNFSFRTLASTVIQGTGLHRMMRRVNRHKPAILMYHGVVCNDEQHLPPWMIREEEFQWQMKYLARHYRVLPLAVVVEYLISGQPFPPHSVAVTFDDGYRNNYTVAYPILRKLSLPATIFLVTGFVESHRALWPDVLFQVIHRTEAESLDLSNLGDGTYQLRTSQDRCIAFYRLLDSMKLFPVEEKDKWLEEITQRLGLNLDRLGSGGNAPYAPLPVHEIRRMAEEGLITFGAHTDRHEILTRLSLAEARREIIISRQQFEALVGQRARFFAYPNGEHDDFNEAIKRIVQRQGFLCAFASTGGLIDSRFDLFALERLGIGPEASRPYFKLKLAGVVAALKRVKELSLQAPSAHLQDWAPITGRGVKRTP